jgi:hypothetical protein
MDATNPEHTAEITWHMMLSPVCTTIAFFAVS